jgi:hypothetical protein
MIVKCCLLYIWYVYVIWTTGLSGYYSSYQHYNGFWSVAFEVASAISDPDSMWIVRQLFLKCKLRPWTQPKALFGRHRSLSGFLQCLWLRIFAWEPLAHWSQTESGSCTNPCLSLHSMLEGLKTSLEGCHSFCASLMATPPLPLHTSTQLGRSKPLNSAVQLVEALITQGQQLFSMRSTHGCENLADPSGPASSWRDFSHKEREDPQTIQIWNILAHLGDKVGQQGCCCRYITKIYLVYTWYIHVTPSWVKNDFCRHMRCPQLWLWFAHAKFESWMQFHHFFSSNETIKPTN